MANPLVPKVPTDHVTYPEIPPIPEGVQRPFWSVMIPTVDRPDMLKIALESVLAEGIREAEMQIMVVDNGSGEETKRLVDEIGQGRVEYFRQPEHVGFAANWTTCIQQARGQWIHILHDDMHVMPGIYAAYQQVIESQQCDVIFSQLIAIDGQGRWTGMTNTIGMEGNVAVFPYQIIAQWNTFVICSAVARRDLYEQVGGYSNQIFYACDHEMAGRLFRASEKVGFLSRPYLKALAHDQQGSTRYWREKMFNKNELVGWQKIIQDNNLPEGYIYAAVSKVFETSSRGLLNSNYYSAAFYYIVWAFRLKPSVEILLLMGNIVYTWRLKWIATYTQRLWRFTRRVLGFVKRRIVRRTAS